ncbi:hypothetical protein EV144_101959 [Flavobacterium sp. 270]|uniref:hypothetical protein n=1 Tax=Flavobacterium sp. 270 TaxID=2512114 RepID=UPI0010648DA5|nr:hypothetical protein [Flavobacterium sp. 270]TDW52270.1 hypothetical protein EV144_101959 [Flavobacterium sp. 270]
MRKGIISKWLYEYEQRTGKKITSINEAQTLVKEIRVADKAGTFKNDKVILANIEKSPAVDGIFQKTGQGVQIKSCTANKFIARVNDSYKTAIENEQTIY